MSGSNLAARIRLSKIVLRNVVLIAAMLVMLFSITSEKGSASLNLVLGGSCLRTATDRYVMCFGLGFCTPPIDLSPFVYVDAYSSLTCPNLAPAVQNTARTDGVFGGHGMTADALGMTSTFRLRGHAWAFSNCNGVTGKDSNSFPEACEFTPGPPIGSLIASPQAGVNTPPNCFSLPDCPPFTFNPNTCTCDSGGPPSLGICDDVGWNWNFASNSCSPPITLPGAGGCPEEPTIICCGCFAPDDGCPYEENWQCHTSPVLIDIAGDGFDLTDAAGGVYFDINGNSDGAKERLSWTATDSDDAWLHLDRNGNGLVDSGRELFGNFTPQTQRNGLPNGFNALTDYDKTSRGGNGDGVIDGGDSVFSALRLWQDANHNGVSEPNELHTLSSLDVVRINLDYKESKRTDEHGNQFRYRAKVDDAKRAKVNRWAWDVYLVAGK